MRFPGRLISMGILLSQISMFLSMYWRDPLLFLIGCILLALGLSLQWELFEDERRTQ